jgi:hypothetical protein
MTFLMLAKPPLRIVARKERRRDPIARPSARAGSLAC